MLPVYKETRACFSADKADAFAKGKLNSINNSHRCAIGVMPDTKAPRYLTVLPSSDSEAPCDLTIWPVGNPQAPCDLAIRMMGNSEVPRYLAVGMAGDAK